MRARTFLLNVIIMLSCGMSFCQAEKLQATIYRTFAICKQPGKYIGWPTIAKNAKGELFAVFSGDRDWHVCPWGKTFLTRSLDNGKTWTEPIVVNNTPLDDRDAGVLVTSKGTVIVSWFTSLAFADTNSPHYEKHYKQYAQHTAKVNLGTRKEWLGNWVRRSTDNGKTWGEYIRTPGNSPHGPILLKDGKLLYVTNEGVAQSNDDGLSWSVIGKIPVDANEKEYLSEVHAVEAGDGKIIALSRHNEKKDKYLRKSVSNDGGKTWSSLGKTDMQGFPAHLLKLENGWIVSSYSRRINPIGQRACLSRDNGMTWDIGSEIELCNGVEQSAIDLGYPSSVELEDGSLLTVYYQVEKPGETPCLMATHWKINEN